MDARYYLLGAVIIQNGRPIAFYSHKLIKIQKRCTVTAKEQLNTVKTLKCFCTILLGQQLKMFKDHKI